MAFLTHAQILQSCADQMHQAVAALPAPFGTLDSPGTMITEAHDAAYNEILGKLLARGFTLAQIAAWDQGPFYERKISLFFVATDNAALFNYDDKFIKLMDLRADLKSVLVSSGGGANWSTPKDSPGTVGSGPENTSSDLFVADDADERRGRVTRW